ncbi:WXG100 family type VII secretion target [Mycobacterium sp. pUA109]|uniref:WXG100 family type VII secretion target n=1 Tax=Mycobacterium sp. pUA109 TaxID=3238982 RepID=UPI00351B0A7D
MGSPGAIDVDVDAAHKAYQDMESKKDDIQTCSQHLDQAVSDIRQHWHSTEKAPPFHNAMEEIKSAFDQQVQQLMGHIDHSRSDLSHIKGF